MAAGLAIGAMALLLFGVGLFMGSPGVEETTVREPAEATEPAPRTSRESCVFRVSGTVTDSGGAPIDSATLELRADGPFATTDRVAVSNYAGRFLYTESGFGTCFLEELFPTIHSEGYADWSRDTAVVNDEELDVILDPGTRP